MIRYQIGISRRVKDNIQLCQLCLDIGEAAKGNNAVKILNTGIVAANFRQGEAVATGPAANAFPPLFAFLICL